jgi:hypothetical protein
MGLRCVLTAEALACCAAAAAASFGQPALRHGDVQASRSCCTAGWHCCGLEGAGLLAEWCVVLPSCGARGSPVAARVGNSEGEPLHGAMHPTKSSSTSSGARWLNCSRQQKSNGNKVLGACKGPLRGAEEAGWDWVHTNLASCSWLLCCFIASDAACVFPAVHARQWVGCQHCSG